MQRLASNASMAVQTRPQRQRGGAGASQAHAAVVTLVALSWVAPISQRVHIMDDIVIQAMAKWPNVPDCYGWLGLDARGAWFMRDAQAQACASFQAACASGEGNAKGKGSKLLHEKLMAFIGRNYHADDAGRWYFQNGPQRVYVELECTPWVFRVSPQADVETHTGEPACATEVITDELGRVYLLTDKGLGLVHTQDVLVVAQLLDTQIWPLRTVDSLRIASDFGFVRSPADHPVKRP